MEYPRAKFHEVNNALWSMHLRGKKKKKEKHSKNWLFQFSNRGI